MTFATPGAADVRAERGGSSIAEAMLRGAAAFWFLVAAAGQWLFVLFILGFYAVPTLTGNFEA
jgi:hypothetical protein